MGIIEQTQRWYSLFGSAGCFPTLSGGSNTHVAVFHSDTNSSLTAENVFIELDQRIGHHTHSKKGILLQIHNDSKAPMPTMADYLYPFIQKYSWWLTESTIPTLQELQGKVQIIRRIPIPTGAGVTWGTDFNTNWPGNAQQSRTIDTGPVKGATNGATNGSANVFVQDCYEYTSGLNSGTKQKRQAISDSITAMSANPWTTRCINF